MSVRQSRHASNLHADGLIRPFNVRSADSLFFGIAHLSRSRAFDDPPRRVPTFIFVVWLAIDLNERREVDAGSERLRNGREVWSESIGRQLKAAGCRIAKLLGENLRMIRFALAEMPRDDHLRVSLKSGEAIGVAGFGTVAVAHRSLFLAPNEPPDFVRLDVIDTHAANRRFKKLLALLASGDHGVNDRIAVNAGDAFDGANRIAFQEHSQAKNHFGRIEAAIIVRSRRFIGERLPARIAAITLRTVAVFSEFAGFGLAKWADHGEPSFLVAAARLELRLSRARFWLYRLIVSCPWRR